MIPKLTEQQISWLRFTLVEELRDLNVITSDTVHHALTRANGAMPAFAEGHCKTASKEPK